MLKITSYTHNLDALKDEVSKSKARHDVLKALMARTFPKHREWILSVAVSVEFLSEWPMLKKNNYDIVSILEYYWFLMHVYTVQVAQEFALILGNAEIRNK